VNANFYDVHFLIALLFISACCTKSVKKYIWTG